MSSEDERLLARLGEALRDCQGREGAEPIEARLAAGGSAEDREVFAPISDRARAAMVDRALHALAPSRRPRPIARRLLMVAAAALPLAAAAAWLLWPAPPLPVYTLALAAGDDTARGAVANPPEGNVVTVSSGSRIDLVLRPASAIDGPLRAELYLAGDPPAALDLPAEMAASGAVRWSGTAEQLVGSRRGDLELVAVVGRPASLPGAAARARLGEARGRGWQSFAIRLRVLNER